jgi:hypothetical protein
MPLSACRPRRATYLPPPALQRAASTLIGALGLAPAARLLGVTRSGLTAVAAGAPVRLGTLELIERRMRGVPEAAAYLTAAEQREAAL